MKFSEDYILFTEDKSDLNFLFTYDEMNKFVHEWYKGTPFNEISRKLKRKPAEIALLIIDLDLRNLIKPRQGGINGADTEL